jgi:peptidoglycan LD-endopeptidase CwlK
MLTLEQVKKKSTARLNGLHSVVKQAAELLIERSYDRGVPIVITQGLRSIEEQNALYAQGRTQAQLNSVGLSHVSPRPGSIVTKAVGGTSYHNFGLAIDFALLMPDGKNVSWDMRRDGDFDKTFDWLEVVEEAKKIGFAWGGDWKSFKDYPHFEMNFGLSLAQLRVGVKPAQSKVDAALKKINSLKKAGAKKVEQQKVKVLVNGKKVADGYLDGGTTYTPSRAVAEALGASVRWDKENLTVHITKEEK